MTMPTIEPCIHHRSAEEDSHGHCTRCGVAVFPDREVGGWNDHTCPPGFTTPMTKSMMATTPVQRVRAFLDRRAQIHGLDQTEIAGLDGGVNVAGGTSLLVADLRALVEGDLKVEINESRDEPTICKVWRNGVLIFHGKDLSASMSEPKG